MAQVREPETAQTMSHLMVVHVIRHAALDTLQLATCRVVRAAGTEAAFHAACYHLRHRQT